jgi:hypothetical protein
VPPVNDNVKPLEVLGRTRWALMRGPFKLPMSCRRTSGLRKKKAKEKADGAHHLLRRASGPTNEGRGTSNWSSALVNPGRPRSNPWVC